MILLSENCTRKIFTTYIVFNVQKNSLKGNNQNFNAIYIYSHSYIKIKIFLSFYVKAKYYRERGLYVSLHLKSVKTVYMKSFIWEIKWEIRSD